MTGPAPVRLLVIAKAPVPGRVKTRLGAEVGMDAAAELAAAALLDTLEVCTAAVGAGHCHLALEGDLAHAACGEEIRAALAGWTVTAQRGDGLGERLVAAHADVPGRRLQVGMDTPQLTPGLLAEAATRLADHDAVLGPAVDGGWWVLGLHEAGPAGVLPRVPMSSSVTYDATRTALAAGGLAVADVEVLRDVDRAADAHAVATTAPTTRFARTWAEVAR